MVTDKILSARVEEATVRRIGLIARHLHTSKKKVIEKARKALNFLRRLRDEDEYEIWTGIMQRAEVVFFTLIRF